MSDAFDKHFGRLMLIAAASALGGGALRFGTDPLREEFAKFREMATKVFERQDGDIQDLNQRVGNIERLYIGPPYDGQARP